MKFHFMSGVIWQNRFVGINWNFCTLELLLFVWEIIIKFECRDCVWLFSLFRSLSIRQKPSKVEFHNKVYDSKCFDDRPSLSRQGRSVAIVLCSLNSVLSTSPILKAVIYYILQITVKIIFLLLTLNQNLVCNFGGNTVTPIKPPSLVQERKKSFLKGDCFNQILMKIDKVVSKSHQFRLILSRQRVLFGCQYLTDRCCCLHRKIRLHLFDFRMRASKWKRFNNPKSASTRPRQLPIMLSNMPQ